MQKIIYVISDIDKALAFEWIATYLDKDRFNLSFILLTPGPSHLEAFLRKDGFTVTQIVCRGKKDWPRAWWKTYRYLKTNKPDQIHCHLLQANIIGLSAAQMAGVSKRIYTRHHSTLHHIYHPKGVFWDKLANRQATHIIAISENVKRILIEWEHVSEDKVHVIPHGFLLDNFRKVEKERKNQIIKKYNLSECTPIVGVISRLTEWKGVQYIVPAFEQLVKIKPDSVLLLLNGYGDYEETIKKQLANLSKQNYRIISFEQDIAAVFHVMDFFVHVPVDAYSEAFGQIYVEALAADIPSIFTLSGIAPDFIRDRRNALVVPFKNSDAIFAAMKTLLEDKNLRTNLKQAGWYSVKDKFTLQKMIKRLEELYDA